MSLVSKNPATGQYVTQYNSWDAATLAETLARAERNQQDWKQLSFVQRGQLLKHIATRLRANEEPLPGWLPKKWGNLFMNLVLKY